jgi:hypothetical protein
MRKKTGCRKRNRETAKDRRQKAALTRGNGKEATRERRQTAGGAPAESRQRADSKRQPTKAAGSVLPIHAKTCPMETP